MPFLISYRLGGGDVAWGSQPPTYFDSQGLLHWPMDGVEWDQPNWNH